MGRTIGAASFLQILAPELNDRMLADFLEMDSNITVNFHIRTIDQAKAIKSIKMKITDLDKMKIEEQKKAVRSGYDMDIIPSDLATFGGEAKRLLQDLQTRNERLFLVTILIMNTATNRQKLENAVFQTAAIAQKYNCALKRLDFQQEEGLMSSLPIGVNQVEIERGLTTSSTAVFVPFTTLGGEGLTGTGRTQDQPVGVFELLAVNHDHVVGQRIQPVVKLSLIHISDLHSLGSP